MIDVRNVITWLQVTQRTKRDRFIFIISLLYLVFMISLKDLVISIANELKVMIDKALMNTRSDRSEYDFCFEVCKNAVQSFKLFWVFRKKEKVILFCFPVFQVLNQQVELPVKSWLFLRVEFDNSFL